MANLGNYNYNVQTIPSGTQGNTPFFTYVVDPNPTDNVSVNPEDLFIFVRLRSFPQNRSVITSDNTYTSRSRDEDAISFIATSNKNELDGKTGYMTTNYTNIGLNETNPEGLGITRISIETAMMTPPKVEIDFVDVRGSAVFNNYEYFDADGVENISKYNSFFRFPYPIYELTVKGYYGRPTTYYLNMIDFNAVFDAEKGDFVIKCKFVGYQFSFLSDVMTKYVIALNATPTGKNYLSKYLKKDNSLGLLTISELLMKYTEIATYTENFKRKDVDYDKLVILNTLSELIDDLTAIVNSPSTLISSPIGLPIQDDLFKSGEAHYFFRDICVFSNKKNNDFLLLQETINNKINEYNRIINFNIADNPSLNDFLLDNVIFNFSKSYNQIDDTLLKDVDAEIVAVEKQSFLSIYQSTLISIQSKFQSYTPVSYISFYEIRDEIYQKKKLLNNSRLNIEEKVVDKLNESYINDIGFNPTVYNVFEIIFGNVDIFLNQLYDTCVKAESIGDIRVNGLKDYYSIQGNLKGTTDIPLSENKIYPFPAVYDLNGERLWLGEVVGENNPNFPEIQIVNDIIKGLTSDELFNVSSNPYAYSEESGYKWIPINAVDYVTNELGRGDSFDYSNLNNSELIKNLIKRLRILYSYSAFDVTNGQPNFDFYIFKYSYVEAGYFVDSIQNDKIIKLLSNIDIDTFVNAATSYNYSNDDVNLGNYYFSDVTGLGVKNAAPISYFDGNNLSYLTDARTAFSSKVMSPTIENLTKANSLSDFALGDLFPSNNFIFDTKYYSINGDLTLAFENDEINKYLNSVSNSIPKIISLNNLNVIDGVISIDVSKNLVGDRSNTILERIGQPLRLGYPNQGETLFSMFYYDKNNEYAKAFLYLKTIGYKDYYYFRDFLYKKASCNLFMTEYYIAYIGGLIKHAKEFYGSGKNFLVDDIKSLPEYSSAKGYDNLFGKPSISQTEIPTFLSDAGVDFFINAFEEFVKKYNGGGFSNYVYNYILPASGNTIGEFETAFDEILKAIKSYKIIAVPSVRLFFKQPILNPTTDFVRKYSQNFITTVKNYANSRLIEIQKVKDEQVRSILTDKNIKIQIYEHLKNIYDKWLSYSTKDGKIYNFANYYVNGNVTTEKRLIDHCYFIDRTWSDIGDKAVLNPKPILLYANQMDGNIYFFMSRILKDNNFNIFNIPSFVNYYDKQDVMEMFKPFTSLNEKVNSSDDKPIGGSCLVFQYVAGNSKVLDLNNRVGYFNDSFDFNANITVENAPRTLFNRNISQSQLTGADLKDYLAKYNLSVFRVAYADQNQNIFKTIQVGQEEHRETIESILVTNELAGGKGATKRLYTGMDLYNAYSVRSYSTEVQCLGNTQILPTQYFQLDNIPLFHGAYIIISVRHEITPNDMVTTFSGRRISKFTYPIIDKITTFLNLELSSVVDRNQFTVPLTNENDYSNGEDKLPTNVDFTRDPNLSNEINQTGTGNANISNNTNILFTIEFNNSISKFSVSTNVNSQELDSNLLAVFKNNNVDTFGLGDNVCATWTRMALEKLGVYRVGGIIGVTDAWNWFMGLPDNNNMYYFSSSDKLTDWSNSDLISRGVLNGSLLFGYSTNSKFKTRAYISISSTTNFPNRTNRKNILTKNKRISDNQYTFTPVTHVGIFYNNQFYNLVNGRVLQEPANNFVPVAYYYFLPRLKNIVANN